MHYLVTGAAGFIGASTVKRLSHMGHHVIGIDNMNDYYSVRLKEDRLHDITHPNFHFIRCDITDQDMMEKIFADNQFDRVIHLAAQPGVRYSLENPHAYIQSNIIGQLNILEACRKHEVAHLVYASSSSVYGLNKKIPFSTADSVDHPVSLYAATKKSDELMSHVYAHLYGLPTTGLRFFTVYGPWGRPDMAAMLFAQQILSNSPINIFNNGNMQRDFTYIDDIVEGIVRISDIIPTPNCNWTPEKDSPAESSAPYRIYNIGNGAPISLVEFIETLEKSLGKTAQKNYLPMQPSDVYRTWADSDDLFTAVNFRPQTSIETGLANFTRWFLDYYQGR